MFLPKEKLPLKIKEKKICNGFKTFGPKSKKQKAIKSWRHCWLVSFAKCYQKELEQWQQLQQLQQDLYPWLTFPGINSDGFSFLCHFFISIQSKKAGSLLKAWLLFRRWPQRKTPRRLLTVRPRLPPRRCFIAILSARRRTNQYEIPVLAQVLSHGTELDFNSEVGNLVVQRCALQL
ncbi:hypothetical protein CRYUN_Cryun28dG0043800 [Craigia yunnanensis]